jgi:hypothetical protein
VFAVDQHAGEIEQRIKALHPRRDSLSLPNEVSLQQLSCPPFEIFLSNGNKPWQKKSHNGRDAVVEIDLSRIDASLGLF